MKSTKIYNLNNDEIKELAANIAGPAFDLMREKINEQLDSIKTMKKEIHINSIINLVIAALSSLDANILIMLRNVYKDMTRNDIDFVLMMSVYLGHVTSIMDQDELKRLKEKMN